jgi:hypothetical protein
MQVKLTSARVGHKYDKAGRFIGQFSQAAGDEVEMPDEEARRYIDNGLATEVKKPNKQ